MATTRGSQLRSSFPAEGTSSGTMLTSEILHQLPKELTRAIVPRAIFYCKCLL
jgi:hypothetical protein